MNEILLVVYCFGAAMTALAIADDAYWHGLWWRHPSVLLVIACCLAGALIWPVILLGWLLGAEDRYL